MVAAADELYLMAHDLQSGKPRIPDQTMGGGLAAALLAELVLAGCAEVAEEGRVLLGEYGPPHEQLVEMLYDQVRGRLARGGLTVRDWLGEQGRTAEVSVADRLVRAGDLRRETTRKLTRTVVRYQPVKPAEMFMRAQRLPSYLRHRVEVTEADVVVARLAQLLAPGRGVLELDEPGTQYLAQLLPALQPSLRLLLAEVESLFGSGVRGPYF